MSRIESMGTELLSAALLAVAGAAPTGAAAQSTVGAYAGGVAVMRDTPRRGRLDRRLRQRWQGVGGATYVMPLADVRDGWHQLALTVAGGRLGSTSTALAHS